MNTFFKYHSLGNDFIIIDCMLYPYHEISNHLNNAPWSTTIQQLCNRHCGIGADNVLIERLEAQNTTTGGIVLPDSAKEKPQKGKIISTGKGKVLDDGTVKKMQVKKGDVVLFTSYAGTEIKVKDKEYLIMEESNILAIIES